MTYLESLNYINNNLTSGSVYGLSRIKELLKRFYHKDRKPIEQKIAIINNAIDYQGADVQKNSASD